MAWDFTADSEIQTELSTKLNEYADNYDAKVAEMYGKIGEMGSYWTGDDYDLFVTGTDGYKTALQDLSNSIRMYSVHFANMSVGTEGLATALAEIINSLTEFSGAAAYGDTSGASGDPNAAPGSRTGGTSPGAAGPDTGRWKTYEDAANAGYAQVMTQEEFDRHKASGSESVADYDSYQDYLAAKQFEYCAPATKMVNGGSDPETSSTPVPYGERIGGRYSESWQDFSGDVSENWNKVHGPLSFVAAVGNTGLDAVNFVGNVVIDSALTVNDTVCYGANALFDVGTGRGGVSAPDYWSSIGDDYSENWDTLRNASNFWEGAGGVLEGTGRTLVDAGQTVVNAAGTAIDWVGNAAEDVGDWLCDAGTSVVDFLFGWW